MKVTKKSKQIIGLKIRTKTARNEFEKALILLMEMKVISFRRCYTYLRFIQGGGGSFEIYNKMLGRK